MYEKEGGTVLFSKIGIFRGMICNYETKKKSIFFLESKNSGSYGDFDIFCLIVGHQEVKNFFKTHFESEV